MAPASFHLKQGRRYRIHMRNESDDLHPIHLHRHSFELLATSKRESRARTGDWKCDGPTLHLNGCPDTGDEI